jgi:hypothetical protein
VDTRAMGEDGVINPTGRARVQWVEPKPQTQIRSQTH